MKKRFRLSLIFMGVMLAAILPNTVNAANYEFDKRNVEKSDGVTKIPVYISASDGEVISQGKLACDIPSTEAYCEIEAIAGEFIGETDNNKNNYVYAPMTENKALSAGNYNVAYVIVYNTSTAKLNDLKVNLKGSSINGESKTAEITTAVTVPKKDEPKSSDATLKSISISQGKISPEFNSSVTEYTVYGIADTINSIRIIPKPNDENASFDISGGKSLSGTSVTLNQGENKVVVSVTAPDNSTTLNYTFTIYRGETNYNSARLESLAIGNYTLTPAFSSAVTEYTISVPNTVTTVHDILQYKLLDEKANALVKGEDNLVVGTNTLTITVDNVSGDETVTYKIIINRLSEENIEVLKYINKEVTFKDADGIQTTLKEEEFERTYPGEYKKIINNEYKFDVDGNIIIEAPEEPKEEEKEAEKKDSKVWLIVVLVIVGLLIISIAGVLIFRKKDKKEDKEKKKDKDSKEETTDEEKTDEEGEKEEPKIGEDFSDDVNKTVDIDEALSDLMNTKQYEFETDEDEEKDK